MRTYLVGDTHSRFGHAQFRLVEAEDVDAAIVIAVESIVAAELEKYGDGSSSEFIAWVYNRDEDFPGWLNRLRNNYIPEESFVEPEERFACRIRGAFAKHPEWGELYVEHYYDPEKRRAPQKHFPIEMLAALYKRFTELSAFPAERLTAKKKD